jgi:cell division protein FtsI/penicillin-binding protein 2
MKRKPAVKRSPKKNMNQVAFTRFMFIIALLVLWFGGIGARLVYLQVSEHDWLRDRALRQRTDVKKTRMLRGSILDRNERALAMSVKAKTLYADGTEIEDPKAAAKEIAKVLEIKAAPIEEMLTEAKQLERKFVPIVKDLEEDEVQRINRLLEQSGIKKSDTPKFVGLHWREGQKRSYPQSSLAAHVVGFSNSDGVGQAGIEQSQNEALYGAVIKKVQERDRLGRIYDETVSEQEAPNDLVLTIDSSIQYKTEAALEKAVTASAAKSGMAVVIDHKTGEILAMANYPTFDPNDLKGISETNLRNNAIQSFYSPGSIFKLVTYSSALDRGLIAADAEINTGDGTIEVAKHKFSDSKVLGSISYLKAMAVSSNVSAVKTGMRVGKEGFYETVRNFGFGKPTGIDLPAETGGMLRAPEKWFGDSLASMSIGYEIGVSPLQMTTAFATIANNGIRVQPHIIKETRRSDETVISAVKAESKRVVSEEAASGLRRMLREVVVAGTGKKARSEAYSTAGKTGTAWKYDPAIKRVSSAKYVSSFMGFAPADKPRITIGVMIDEPRNGGRNGGDVAAPVFLEIVDTVLPAMNIAPDAPGLVVDDIEELIAESVGNGETDETQASLMTDDREVVATKPKPDMPATEPKKEKPQEPKTKPDAVSAAKPKSADEKKKGKEIEKREKPKNKT